MPGPFSPQLHPHGWHGHWQFNGGRLARHVLGRGKGAKQALNRQVDVISHDGVRVRARPGSGKTFAHGPAANVRGDSGGGSGGSQEPRLLGQPMVGNRIRVRLGNNHHHVPATVIHHKRDPNGVHHVKVRTTHGVHTFHVKAQKLKTRPSRTRGLRPLPSAFVDHVPIGKWWAGAPNTGRHGLLPFTPNRPSGRTSAAPRPRVRKDEGVGTMTEGQDLDHEGQAPVTVTQAGTGALARCPLCGQKLGKDGACSVHGRVAKAKAFPPPNLRLATGPERCGGCKMFRHGHCMGYNNLPVKKHWTCDSYEPEPITKTLQLRTGGAPLLRKEASGFIPSTGEALAPNTVEPSRRKTKKKPKANEPAGPIACPDCGGTDGFHSPTCPRAVLNPGGGPVGLGSS